MKLVNDQQRLKKANKKQRPLTSVEVRSTESTVNDTVTVSVNDNVKDNNSILYRKTEFKNSLQPFLEDYGKDLLNNFFEYWTEKKPKGRKDVI